MIGVYAGSDINVDTDVNVGELRVDEWVDRGSAYTDAGLEAAGGDGHAATDIELGGLAVNGANLRILDDRSGGIGEQEVGRGTGQGHRVVSGTEVEAFERDAGRGGGGGSAGGSGAGGRCRSRGCEGDGSGLAGKNAEVAQAAGAGGENLDLNDDLRLGFVNVFEQAAGDGQ